MRLPNSDGITFGFVFQEYNLLDTLTLKKNVALPLTIKGLESGGNRQESKGYCR